MTTTTTTTTDLTINTGDRVRSFDSDYAERRQLEGELANYVEGVVIGTVVVEGCERYEIKVEREVCQGEDITAKDYARSIVLPPVNGTPTSMGNTTDGVVKLDDQADDELEVDAIDGTILAGAYTSARRHLERAAELLDATPAREVARSAAQICRDLALEAIKDRPECDVEACTRAARSDASLLVKTHANAVVELAKLEAWAKVAHLAEALAELEGAVIQLVAVEPAAQGRRSYRVNSARASVLVAQANELVDDEGEIPGPRVDEGERQAAEVAKLEAELPASGGCNVEAVLEELEVEGGAYVSTDDEDALVDQAKRRKAELEAKLVDEGDISRGELAELAWCNGKLPNESIVEAVTGANGYPAAELRKAYLRGVADDLFTLEAWLNTAADLERLWVRAFGTYYAARFVRRKATGSVVVSYVSGTGVERLKTVDPADEHALAIGDRPAKKRGSGQ